MMESDAEPRDDRPPQPLLDATDAGASNASGSGPDTPRQPLPATVDLHTPALNPPATPPDHTPVDENAQTFDLSLGDRDRTRPMLPRPSDPALHLVRQSVPGFEILQELGRGGMGVVYLARQEGLNRLVALKMILSGAHASEAERERFRREAEAVAQLKHPHIVQIYEIGEVEECPYLAFEYVDGGTLASHLHGDPLPPRQAAVLVEHLALAMDYAHRQGIIHRDLKPGNVLLARGGEAPQSKADGKRPPALGGTPKITDFGLAKRVVTGQTPTSDGSPAPAGEKTRTGAVMGTPSYIAPEQAAGKNREVGTGADIYALGAILYELLTGRPPFKGETPLDTVLQVMSSDPVSPSQLLPKIPRDLDTICMKCLQKQPARRYPTAGELAADLRRFSAHEPILARPVSSLERLTKWARRHPTAAWLGLFSSLTVVVLLAVSVYFNFQLKEANRRASDEAADALQQRRLSDLQRLKTEEVNRELEKRNLEVEKGRKEVARREEINRRGGYALQLSQAAALAERDPRRAVDVLDQQPEAYRDFTWNYLRRLAQRELQVWKDDPPRQPQGISGVSFCPDGSLLASACWDSTVRLYDPATLRPLATLRASGGLLLSVAFSPEGRTLAASGDDGRIHLWEVPPPSQRGELDPSRERGPFAVLRGHRGQVRAVLFNPRTHQLISAGEDGDLRFWSIPPSPVDAGMILGSPAGAFARGGAEQRAALLPTPTIPAPTVVEGHGRAIWALEVSRDGETLFTGGEDRTVRVWDLRPMPHDFPAADVLHTFQDGIAGLSHTAGGEQGTLAIATTSEQDPSIRFWDVEEKRELTRLRGHTRSVNAIAFHPDGKLLLSGSLDKTVRLWDWPGGQERLLLRGHEESVRGVALSPTRPLIASGDSQQQLHLWNIAPRREASVELPIRSAGPAETLVPVDCAALSLDGRRLAVGDHNGVVRVWFNTGPEVNAVPQSYELRLLGHREGVTRLAFSRDGQALVSVSRDEVRIWEVGDPPLGANPKKPRDFTATRPPRRIHGPIRGLSLDAGQLIVVSDRAIHLFDRQGEQHRTVPVPGGVVRAAAFHADGKHLATLQDQTLKRWDLQTFGHESCGLASATPARDVASLAFEPLEAAGPHSPTGWRLIAAHASGRAELWDLLPASGEEPLRMQPAGELIGHGEKIGSLSVTPNRKTLATGSDDRTIKLWDPLTGADRATLNGHSSGVVLVAFLPNNRALLSVGREGVAKLWRAEE